MDFAALEPALCALFATLTGIEAACVRFENVTRVHNNGRLALLSWVSSTGGAQSDDTSWAYAAAVDPLAEMTPTVAGPRALVLQVRVESFDQRPGQTARQILERAKTRMQAPSTLAALLALNVAFAGVGGMTNLDAPTDSRVTSVCAMEVRLNAEDRYADASGATSYLATSTITSTITCPDGAAAPVQSTGSFP